MLPITVHNHGYLIGKELLILTTDEPQKNLINLCLHKGETMRYGKSLVRVVDFPGEYEMWGVPITCYESGGVLHYLLRMEDEQIAIIRNTSVLEQESFDGIHQWICQDKKCSDAVENLELTGTITILDDIA